MWQWMLTALAGGNFSSLVKQVVPHDISALYRKLKKIIGSVTICTLADEVEAYVKLSYDPSRDIFDYLNEMNHAYARIEAKNKLLKPSARVEFNEAFKKTKILRALNQAPKFEFLINRIVSMTQDEWGGTTVEQLTEMIQTHYYNAASCEGEQVKRAPQAQQQQQRVPQQKSQDEARANMVQAPKGICYKFRETGNCPAETAGLNTKKHKSPILQQRKRVLHPQRQSKRRMLRLPPNIAAIPQKRASRNRVSQEGEGESGPGCGITSRSRGVSRRMQRRRWWPSNSEPLCGGRKQVLWSDCP